MPAKSKAQQKFMGMVHGVQKGTIKPSTVSAKVKKAAKGMKKKSATDYASTKHKGLPKKVTVKEISKWLKKLEEFRYRKVRGVDARRVASFVNRGMNEEDLPMSLRKKWEHRKYGREKHLANRYMTENGYDSVQKEGFGGELNDKDKQKFEKARKNNAEVLGYELSGTPDVKEDRDYKAEYKKYGSSTAAKKYRAELNQYNRKKGTYGNGDGKDASHKGGKIVGYEKESVNRGRAEKSRLKKEGKLKEGMSSSQAKTLLQQLGGNKFMAMTGAKDFGIGSDGLHFKIGRNAKSISHVVINLSSMDLYDMKFLRVRAGKIKVVKKVKGVYFDMLGDIFKRYTGMNVRL